MDLLSNKDNFRDYISLAQAESLTGISKDYFRVCIQKRYLRGVKIGRNWTTTIKWLEEYLNHYRSGVVVSKNLSNIIYPDPALKEKFEGQEI